MDPAKSAGILIMPTIGHKSARHLENKRQDRKRVETKIEGAGCLPVPVTLLMNCEHLHGNDRRQRSYDVYMIFAVEAEALQNPFCVKSYLSVRGSTMADATWMKDNQAYIVLDIPGAASSFANSSLDRYVSNRQLTYLQ